MCYSFEPSGHRFRPLDQLGEFVVRLYCPSCSRIVMASTLNNVEGWDVKTLPPESQVDFMSNFPADRKPDA
jgi:hypothetical protein